MGSVWLAQHTGLDVPCAVKFIHDEAARSPELRARFEREAKAAAQLRSPHVVQILDHGVWQGAPYIAMELLEGEDLAKRLRRRGRLEPEEVSPIAAQVARALTRAHAAGLVHRDLKPGNIFLVSDDDREIAKVLDFGVAKATTALGASMDTDETRTGAILGTPFYMSPEQARGNKDIDHRADLWALAVVIYKCLTGKLPFQSPALGDLLVKIIVEPLPRPSEFAPLPPGFDAWWARAADRDITQRFQTARELADTLCLALEITLPPSSEVGGRVSGSFTNEAALHDGAARGLKPHAEMTRAIPLVTVAGEARGERPILGGVTHAGLGPLQQRARAVLQGRPSVPVDASNDDEGSEPETLKTSGGNSVLTSESTIRPSLAPEPMLTPLPVPVARRTPVVAAMLVAVVLAIGAGAFALHEPSAHVSAAAPSVSVAIESAAAPPVAPEAATPKITAAPEPSVTASATLEASAHAPAKVQAATPHTPNPSAPATKPPAPSAPSKPRVDFGI